MCMVGLGGPAWYSRIPILCIICNHLSNILHSGAFDSCAVYRMYLFFFNKSQKTYIIYLPIQNTESYTTDTCLILHHDNIIRFPAAERAILLSHFPSVPSIPQQFGTVADRTGHYGNDEVS